MKHIYSFLALVFTALLVVQCKKDQTPELGKIKIDGVGMSIVSAKLTSAKAQNSTDDNIHAFHFYIKDEDAEREVKIVLSHPYNYTNMDGDYNILNNTRQMSITDSFYFVKRGNSTQYYSNLSIGQCSVKKLTDGKYKVSFVMQTENGPMLAGNIHGRVEVQ